MAKRSVKDLALKGRRGLHPRRLQRADQERHRSPTTRASARRCRRSSTRCEQGATVILCSHLGRPKGKPNPEFTLKPVAEQLSALLSRPVAFAPDCVGEPAQKAIAEAGSHGGVILLENLRFHAEEEKNDPAFARQLAALADVYVNDAFGSAHRAHASTEGIVQHVKESAAGLLMAAEVEYLGKVLEHPDRPFVAILGGAKVSDKLEVIENLIPRVDALLIGGAMAYTFFKARGIAGRQVARRGRPARRGEGRRDARARRAACASSCRVDHVVAPKLEAGVADGNARRRRRGHRRSDGPRHRAEDDRHLPVGHRVGEDRDLERPDGRVRDRRVRAGTIDVAKAVAAVKGTTIIGGGDSIAAVAKAGVTDRMTHISTGGGASLEFLGGRTLPGVAALPDK